MKLIEDTIRLSASDLTNHLACRHLTRLNFEAAHGRLSPPEHHDPLRLVLQERGLEHEDAYIAHLTATGETITDLRNEDSTSAIERTRRAMQEGRKNIVQATLALERWYGRADILKRVERPSKLGEWGYEVIETKLARETRAGTILELCLYSEMVKAIQGKMPESIHVVARGTAFELESFRLGDFLAYYRLVRGKLEGAVDDRIEQPKTYPDPVPHCDICLWRTRCDLQRREDDHLCLVAGISKLQTRELQQREIATLVRLAEMPIPIAPRPHRGASEGYTRVREQARVQKQGREAGRVCHELLPLESERGLALLPEPSEGDVFFDIEGDSFIREGGFEFLIGYALSQESLYEHRWAYNPAEEQSALEWFVDAVMQRREQYPDMHVYHFAPYDPAALKRMMGRYATRETEIDTMLRSRLFIDLHAVVKQAMRASVEQYSLKDMEIFHSFKRELPLEQASPYLWGVKRALELGRAQDITEEALGAVLSYNKDDCLSALSLRDWLEKLRAQCGQEIARPEAKSGEANEEITEQQQRVNALKEFLLQNISPDIEDRTGEEQARWLLASMLEWHRREDKAKWWEYYRLLELSEEDLMEEKSALSGLKFEKRTGGKDRCPIHQYSYPQQDSDIRKGDTLFTRGEVQVGTVEVIDLFARTLDIKKRGNARDLHSGFVFAYKIIPTKKLFEALLMFGDWVVEHGMENTSHKYRAARDLLLRNKPRLIGGAPLQIEGEEPLLRARRLASVLESSVLPIQGPPGSGKTSTAARMICELAKAGKFKVGITANSHKVIAKLLEEVVAAAKQEGLSVRCIKKGDEGLEEDNRTISTAKTNGDISDALSSGSAQVAGGTAWLWSSEDFAEAVDVLFVDEAGQMSLANVLACAQGAKSLVLLGDPQQLDQPLQGSHPEGTEVSALQHLLGEEKTLSDECGLFLPQTYRLAPSICNFTSELFYEGRLTPHEGREKQRLSGGEGGGSPFVGSGLWFLPVEHEGNQNSSHEEAQKVREVAEALLHEKSFWTNAEGEERLLRLEDILVVAPYNAQVAEISAAMRDGGMGEARVGTVDKFQGQEAPVVIYSMATSSPEEAPRGMEFLYSLHRFNVAVSRARCASLLVGSPRLFAPDCKSPRQMRLANAFCRYRELVTLPD